MRSAAIRFIIAAVLFAAGAAAWAEAKVARRVADAYQRFATLHYDVDDRIGDATSALDRLPLPMDTLGTDIRRHRATVAYWRSEYGGLTAPLETAEQQAAAADPTMLLIRANAAFRASLNRLGDSRHHRAPRRHHQRLRRCAAQRLEPRRRLVQLRVRREVP